MLVTDAAVAAALSVPIDSNLTRLNLAVDAYVKKFCGRTFERAADRVEFVRGYYSDMTFLREDPVEAITEVRIDATAKFGADTIVTDLSAFWTEANRLYYRGGFFPEGPRVGKITLTSGYATAAIPEDLKDIVIQLIAEKLNQGTSERLKSEAIGSYSYTRFEGAITPAIRQVLNSYRRW